MLLHVAKNSILLPRPEPALLRELDALQPDLPGRLRLADMDVRRLARLVAVEIEAVAIDAQDGGHRKGLRLAGAFPKFRYAWLNSRLKMYPVPDFPVLDPDEGFEALLGGVKVRRRMLAMIYADDIPTKRETMGTEASSAAMIDTRNSDAALRRGAQEDWA